VNSTRAKHGDGRWVEEWRRRAWEDERVEVDDGAQ
jgi:hypothetical protein